MDHEYESEKLKALAQESRDAELNLLRQLYGSQSDESSK